MDNTERHTKLATQIERRLKTLKKWAYDGVPEGYSLPTSLNMVRKWTAPELGIDRIGSPSSFTTNHKDHGRSVAKIQKLLIKLQSPAKKINKPSASRQLHKMRAKQAVQKEALINAANRYAILRSELDKSEQLFRVARQSQIEAQQELASAEETIRKLKGELVRARSKVTQKNVTSIGFRDKESDE